MQKVCFPVILAAIFLCSCGSDSTTGPDSSGFSGPVLDANEIAGNWEMESLEVNGVTLFGKTIRGWGSDLWTVQALTGTINFSPTSEGGGTFTCRPAATASNVSDASLLRNSSRVLTGTFGIPDGGAIAIVLTGTQSEDPRYQNTSFGGLINFVSGKLVLEFKQSTFARDNKNLYPTFGHDLVDNSNYTTRVVARLHKF